jgi:2-C-methyl-D-erythritol 2,4-cyclodiphosphate synthase
MKQVLAEVMAIREEDISIKATTTEHLGFVGRKEGIAAYAVALIYTDTENSISGMANRIHG